VKNHYDILGVGKSSTQDEIKKAYRFLARKYHPDHNRDDKSAEERFKEVNGAYETLGDEKKRAQYDSLEEARARGFSGYDGVFGDLFGGGRGRGGPGAGSQTRRFDDLGSFRDIFGSFFDPGASSGFGGSAGAGAPAKGRDRTFTIEVPFNVAVRGGISSVRVPREDTCPACKGSGAAPGTTPQTCDQCGGRGQIQIQQGTFAFTRPCPACFGRGVRISSPCPDCTGTGRKELPRTLQVKIPKGIRDGAKVRMRSEGDPGTGGAPPGDLFLKIRVLPHEGFRRSGLDLESDLEIEYTTAVLGGTAEVLTFWGAGTLKIPPGIQPGALLRLRGRGVAREDGTRGDHLVRVSVRIPRSLNPKQRELVEKLKAEDL